MIACVGPGSSSADHTLNTLRYAQRLKDPVKMEDYNNQIKQMEQNHNNILDQKVNNQMADIPQKLLPVPSQQSQQYSGIENKKPVVPKNNVVKKAVNQNPPKGKWGNNKMKQEQHNSIDDVNMNEIPLKDEDDIDSGSSFEARDNEDSKEDEEEELSKLNK